MAERHGRIGVPEGACCLHPCPIEDCPEPICFADFHGGRQAFEAHKRAMEIKRLRGEGKSPTEIADTMGISLSTVERALSNRGVNGVHRQSAPAR